MSSSASRISPPLYKLFARRPNPVPADTVLYHSRYEPSTPLVRILGSLPISALLELRLVSRLLHDCVGALKDMVFSALHIHYPPTAGELETTSIEAFTRIACLCRILYISIESTGTTPAPDMNVFMAHVSSVTTMNLRIRQPNPTEPSTLLHIRTMLENGGFQNLRSISIGPLTLEGVLAMRWGPLTSFSADGGGDWMRKRFWGRIRGLVVHMVPWWEYVEYDDITYGEPPGVPPSSNRRMLAKERKEHRQQVGRQHRTRYRMGMKVLHSWLSSFAPTLEILHFAWVDLCPPPTRPAYPGLAGDGDDAFFTNDIDEHRIPDAEAPSPLTIDLLPIPFSAPPIAWRELRHLCLSGVKIDRADIAPLLRRATRLERLLVDVSGMDADDTTHWNEVVTFPDDSRWVDVDIGLVDPPRVWLDTVPAWQVAVGDWTQLRGSTYPDSQERRQPVVVEVVDQRGQEEEDEGRQLGLGGGDEGDDGEFPLDVGVVGIDVEEVPVWEMGPRPAAVAVRGREEGEGGRGGGGGRGGF